MTYYFVVLRASKAEISLKKIKEEANEKEEKEITFSKMEASEKANRLPLRQGYSQSKDGEQIGTQIQRV